METTDENAAVVAIAADLLFASRVRGAAKAAGAELVLARTEEQALEAARGGRARLILLDLDARAVDAPSLIGALKAGSATESIPIVAFGAHVRGEALRAARDAGADRVLARSRFVQELPELMASVARGA